LGGLLLWEAILGNQVFEALQQEKNMNQLADVATYLPLIIYVLGGMIMAVFLFTSRRDIMLWFPAKIKRK
jgi:hypothetical protein